MTPVKATDISGWISAVDGLLKHGTCDEPGFLRPYHFLVLAVAIQRLCAATGMAPSLRLPRNVEKYAARMHLWNAIGQPSPHAIHEQPSNGRFAPVELLTSRDEAYDSAARIAQVARHSTFDPQAQESLATGLSEVIENCFAHADLGETKGMVCAQYWEKGSRLQIAVCDGGKGIRENLIHADTSPIQIRAATENACELATELEISSKLTADHAGYGLALLRQLVEQNQGTMSIHSGNEWFHTCRGHATRGTHPTPWQGTLVVAEFNTKHTLSSRAVYSSWPNPPRGYSHDDFDNLFD